MKDFDDNELSGKILLSLKPASANALTSSEIKKLGGLGNGIPLPEIVKKILEFRGPEWDFPGMWKKDEVSSIKGLTISVLIKLILADDDFKPSKFWNIGELSEELPGRCYPLGLDNPAPFLYVGTDKPDDCPVMTLVQSDDALEVVVEAPNVTVFYAMKLGIIECPKYYGGLANDPDMRKAMIVSLKASGLSPISTPERFYWTASLKEIKPSIPAVKSVPTELPDWIIKHCAPWIDLASMVWKKILECDDKELVRAFQACEREARITDVEGKKADTLRKRMLAELDTSSVPLIQFALMFAVVSELEPGNAANILLQALEIPVVDFYHKKIRDWLISIAVCRIYNEKKFWDLVLNDDLTFETVRDSNLYFNLGIGLAKTKLFTDEMYFSDIENIIRRKSDESPGKGLKPEEKKFIHLKMIALLMRDTSYKERMEGYGTQYAELLKIKGQEEWIPLHKQEMETIFRKCLSKK